MCIPVKQCQKLTTDLNDYPETLTTRVKKTDAENIPPIHIKYAENKLYIYRKNIF